MKKERTWKYAGEIYKEDILSRKDLIDKTLPDNDGDSELIKDLFGFKLVSGKYTLQCETEAEARYLKVFWDTGIKEVKIPKDKSFLKNILVKLEESKKIVDDRMNHYMQSILRKQDRERLRREVYEEFAKVD